MKFTGEEQLVANGKNPIYKKLRADALLILKIALEAVDPGKALLNKVKINGNYLSAENVVYDLSKYKRVFVVGGGKAGGSMAKAIEDILLSKVSSGVINVLKGTETSQKLKKIKLVGASHPVPDQNGVEGVDQMYKLLSNLSENDLIIVLISGGGSALMPYPAEGVKLDELQAITSRLLRKGATINDLNVVRKHLDSFKGGQLAKRCYPAHTLALILSDVVGDPLDTIASGPTVPDQSTWNEAKNVLLKYGAWNEAPGAIKERIERGLRREINDTPKASDPVFSNVKNVIIANNSVAAEAAAEKAGELGYNTLILSTMVEGEARHIGAAYSGIAREVVKTGRPISPPAAILIGGETTVNVTGKGKGGRNQEVALASAKKISGYHCLITSLATDGIDGQSDAAGGLVDGATSAAANRLNLSIDEYLSNNDSYNFFSRLGDLLITGPTGTNVNDLALCLIADG